VATSSPIHHGVNGFIADDAAEFADYVAQLYADRALCRQMGDAARQTIADQFSQAKLTDDLRQLIDQFSRQPSQLSVDTNGQVACLWRWMGYWLLVYLPFSIRQQFVAFIKRLIPLEVVQHLKHKYRNTLPR